MRFGAKKWRNIICVVALATFMVGSTHTAKAECEIGKSPITGSVKHVGSPVTYRYEIDVTHQQDLMDQFKENLGEPYLPDEYTVCVKLSHLEPGISRKQAIELVPGGEAKKLTFEMTADGKPIVFAVGDMRVDLIMERSRNRITVDHYFRSMVAVALGAYVVGLKPVKDKDSEILLEKKTFSYETTVD